jgi:hypothetical protein
MAGILHHGRLPALELTSAEMAALRLILGGDEDEESVVEASSRNTLPQRSGGFLTFHHPALACSRRPNHRLP